MGVGARHEIPEGLRGLKGARKAGARDVVRGLPSDLAASDPYGPGIRMLESADEIEQRGFASPVGTDHTGHAAGLRVQIYARDRDDSAKRDANPFGEETAASVRDMRQSQIYIRRGSGN